MITLGRNICRDLGEALSHEWLVTNGLGGYAAGTLPGVNTRRYHGLLIAALTPPVERTQLVANCDEEVEMDGVTYFLGANEYQDERIHPGGFVHLESFVLDHALPRFVYRVGPAFLQKQIWMEYGRNTTYVRYTVLESPYPLTLILRPFVNYRDHHKLTKGSLDWSFGVTALPIGGGCTVTAFAEAHPFYLVASPKASFTPSGVWYWKFLYRAERERGLDFMEDLYLPGVFRGRLTAGQSLTLIASAEPLAQIDRNVDTAFGRAQGRQERLLRRAGLLPTVDARDAAVPTKDQDGQAFITQLVQAADQFLVQRGGAAVVPPASGPVAAPAAAPVVYTRAANPPTPRTNRPGALPTAPLPPPAPAVRDAEDTGPRTVIAGYPWFTDWGRDTMIALPGLTLATGRLPAADSLLRTFARYIDQGMVPNLFPDAGTAPEYNTVDATLWYFHAIDAYLQAGGAVDLAHDLWPHLQEIVRWHIQGTRYGIQVDPADGLLRAGEPGVQLTWMDAKVGDTVFTPRHGKPVEIQALWYHALRIMARLQTQLGYPDDLPLAVPPADPPADPASVDELKNVPAALLRDQHATDPPADPASVAELKNVPAAPLRDQHATDPPAAPPSSDELKNVPAAPLRDVPTAPLREQNSKLKTESALSYAARADQVRASFQARFWYAHGGYLYDVIDGPDSAADPSLRPNQLFALSLEPDLVTAEQARGVLAVVQRELLTPVGLRTLAPSDPRFKTLYTGDQAQRDAAYHQGIVWPWLMGAYGDAARRWAGMDRAGMRRLLAPLQRQLAVDCAGTLNEIFEPTAPFRPKGCFAQAWSVAEVLRLLCAEWPA